MHMCPRSVPEASNACISHQKLVAAIKAVHRANPCIKHADIDLAAMDISNTVRMLLRCWRELRKCSRTQDVVRSKVATYQQVSF